MRRHPGATPDPDGVALAVAVTVGVLVGARLACAAWGLGCLAAGMALLVGRPRLAHTRGMGSPGGAGWSGAAGSSGGAARRGLLVLGTLACAAALAASLRADAVRGGLLARGARSGAVATVQGTVAEEPAATRGGQRLVLSVVRAEIDGRAWRTRERATVFVPAAAGRFEAGDRLRLRGRLAADRRADRLGRVPAALVRRPVLLGRTPGRWPPLRLTAAVRAATRERASGALPPDQAGLLVGMALGDTSRLAASVDASFKAAGLTHLLAVSGANLAVVLAAGLGLVARLHAGRRGVAAVGAALVLAFVLLTRWQPSVLRAGVMAVLALLGLATGRGPGARRALCLAVCLLLLVDPALAGSLGFALSVAATAGVLWIGPLLTRILPARLPAGLRAAVAVTLAAQAGALPVLAGLLGQVSLAGLPANLLALPLASAPMLLGIVAAALATVWPSAAAVSCRLAGPFLAGLLAVAHSAAGLPGSSIRLGGAARLVPVLVAGILLLLARRQAARLDSRAGRARAGRAGVTPRPGAGPDAQAVRHPTTPAGVTPTAVRREA